MDRWPRCIQFLKVLYEASVGVRWISLHASCGVTPQLKSPMTVNLKQSKVNQRTHKHIASVVTENLCQVARLKNQNTYSLKTNATQKYKYDIMSQFLRADIRLIDDFVPHQSIMHNLTRIKSHINIITHWILHVERHAVVWSKTPVWEGVTGVMHPTWVGKHMHTFPLHPYQHKHMCTCMHSIQTGIRMMLRCQILFGFEQMVGV